MNSPLTKRQRLLLRWVGLSLVVAIGLGVILFQGRPGPQTADTKGKKAGITSVLSREVKPEMVRFRFEEVALGAGIRFRHFPAARHSLLPEDMGPGVAWGDYDNDGDPDLFLVNFQGSILDDGPGAGLPALYRNDGAGRFTDVTRETGLARPVFGQSACWGDYDNDGDPDLFLGNYGPNILYRNDAAAGFTDVTATAGVGDDRFSAGCAWADYDNDGNIDLYVTNYVKFSLDSKGPTAGTRQYGTEIPYTINPSSYPPAGNRLYRNDGSGGFIDVAARAGVENSDGRSLGAAWFDFDNDGLLDLYVANDVSANGVYHNLGDGNFADIGASSLAADYRGAMGLAVGDYEHDGDLDLFVTHWVAQENALFENMTSEKMLDAQGRPRLFFMDGADLMGLGQQSLKMVGWATGFADFDNDAYPDLWVVNGNTLEQAADNTLLKPQRMQIFRHQPGRGYFDIGVYAAPVLEQPIVGRGGAHADYDGDGRMDIAVMVHGGTPLLLHNTTKDGGHWLAVRLRQDGGNTQALGARVSLRTGERTQTAQVGASGSYLSQHYTDLHFGLGASARVDELTIRWPDGSEEQHTGLETDRLVHLNHVADYGRQALTADE